MVTKWLPFGHVEAKIINKRQELKEKAIGLFSENGFYQTSVQEIAKECNISKGGFYKHFHSKESLLIEILKDNHAKLFDELNAIGSPESMPKLELFKKRVMTELQQVMETDSVFMILFKEIAPNDNKEIFMTMENFKNHFHTWHKQSLLEAFGVEIKPNIWDLVAIFEGIIMEYVHILIHSSKKLSVDRLANSIVSAMVAIMGAKDDIEPVLTEIFADEEKQNRLYGSESLESLFEETKDQIISLGKTEMEKEKLQGSLSLLVEEFRQENTRNYLVESLLLYLKTCEELDPFTQRIEKIVQTRGK